MTLVLEAQQAVSLSSLLPTDSQGNKPTESSIPSINHINVPQIDLIHRFTIHPLQPICQIYQIHPQTIFASNHIQNITSNERKPIHRADSLRIRWRTRRQIQIIQRREISPSTGGLVLKRFDPVRERKRWKMFSFEVFLHFNQNQVEEQTV